MTQQVINIGSAPDDSTGDPLRSSFDKTNENFTELYAKGATEGLWNYNQTSTDTSTSPVSGRFKTNSGNYRDATQIAIHAITIQGIDRSSTLRTLLVGDLIQCQDSTNTAAWCRYSLQSLPVDHGTWFQLNVTFQADGGVASGDNQEIVFIFTASSGSSGGGGNVSNSGTPTNGQLAQWTDATHIQGVAPSSLGFAPIASPTFTGDPKAPTPTAGDNDFSIATTAFVQDTVSNASGGAAGTAEYNFSTIISPPPNSGDIRVNNATPSAVTILWINNVTRLGSDIKRILQQIQVGSKLVIQDKGNSANYGAFQVAGTLVDQTTYWEIPVTFSVGAGTIANNTRILFGVQAPGAMANVSNSGTPAAGQYAKWTDATHIQGVATPTVLSDIGAAPVGAEYIASTADATLTAERVLTDTATVTWDRTTAGQIKANAAGGSSTVTAPQGRLTLQTLTPVMTTTQAAKTTILYSPYVGNLLPIYNGTSFAMTTFAELSVATTDTTKSPAAIGASKVNDWFVWNDAGTVRVGHGPDWTSDTVRSAGTALVMVNGILLNNAAITNGPAAQRGTYVGTTRSNASSTLDWIYGAIASLGTAAWFGVWNAYNRVSVSTMVGDTTLNWTNGGAVKASNGSNAMRVSAIFGLAEDTIAATFICPSVGVPGTVNAVIGIGLDSTSAFSSGAMAANQTSTLTTCDARYSSQQLGWHFWQAMENSSGATSTFYGQALPQWQNGLFFDARM